MKKIIAILILIFLANTNFAQDIRVYHSLKYGVFSAFFNGPTSIVETSTSTTNSSSSFTGTITNIYDNASTISLSSLIYTFRYNITEPSDNFGLGINAAPSLAATIGDRFGSLNLPIYLSANFGAGSTYKTASNFGGFIGLGYEFNKIGLIGKGSAEVEIFTNTKVETFNPKSSWLQPMLIGGIRWWSGEDRLVELSFKYGFGSNKDFDLPIWTRSDGPTSEIGSPRTIQFVYGWFIGY